MLIIGDAAAAFADGRQPGPGGCKSCENILDGITLATREDFDTILVVMSSFGRRLESALKTLRRVSRKARIILLAQMYDEPQAREMMRRPGAGGDADDYLICPANIDLLVDSGKQVRAAETSVATAMPQSDYKDARIRELEKLAMEDDLTGLKNRRYVREFLRQILKRASRDDLRVTLLVFDIDDFKHYNDAYGHAIGDNVLRQASAMMLRCCREHDVVGRIGGDEFAVVFWDRPGTPDKATGTSDSAAERRQTKEDHPREPLFMAERFRKEISSAELTFLGPKGKGALTISGGLASFPDDGVNVSELFEQADKAMLEAKRSGKNRIDLVGKAK